MRLYLVCSLCKVKYFFLQYIPPEKVSQKRIYFQKIVFLVKKISVRFQSLKSPQIFIFDRTKKIIHLPENLTSLALLQTIFSKFCLVENRIIMSILIFLSIILILVSLQIIHSIFSNFNIILSQYFAPTFWIITNIIKITVDFSILYKITRSIISKINQSMFSSSNFKIKNETIKKKKQ